MADKSLSELARITLDGVLPDRGCDALNLPRGTTFKKALVLGTVERALRGSAADAALVIEMAGGGAMLDDEAEDSLSAALRELAAEFEAERAQSSESD